MATLESTVTIARPVDEVFRFFLDLDTNARRTDANVESVARTPDGPTRPGTTFHFCHRALGRIRETTTTFVSLDPNRKIEIEARLGPLRLLSPIFARIGQKVWDERLARLKRALELQTDLESDTEIRRRPRTSTLALAGIIGRWRNLATYTMLTGIAVLLLFVAVGFFAIDDGAPLHTWTGLLQRVLCAVWFTCLIVLALRLRSV